ncbi:hypothetical protein GCM10027321_21070 [Massilia terrae]|uniref:DUF2029 domain-containing protein n=1 Tax=Massilia terrae TaxID=1811224 RepID=A0ABT2CV84_9BURK|nr:hypothetical protein [Massilia terrae]MCS0657886.1 hypothetical protein [Massilia terrae]
MLSTAIRVRAPAQLPLLTITAFGTLAYLLMAWRWGGTVEDSLAYFDTARHLRGEIPVTELRAPFPYRLLVPGIAAMLPGELHHAFASLNWALVTASAVLMWQTVLAVGAGNARALLAGLLMLLSLPVYWYAPYLLVDPGSVCARSLFVFALLAGQPWLALFAGLVATAVREENILLLGWLLLSGRVSLRAGFAALAAAALWLLAVRWWIIGGLPSYTWRPNWWTVRHALQDIPSLLSMAGCAGVVLPLGLFGLWRAPAQLKPLAGLMLLMTLPLLYAAMSVRIDGRAIWGLYPFLIPLAATVAIRRAP